MANTAWSYGSNYSLTESRTVCSFAHLNSRPKKKTGIRPSSVCISLIIVRLRKMFSCWTTPNWIAWRYCPLRINTIRCAYTLAASKSNIRKCAKMQKKKSEEMNEGNVSWISDWIWVSQWSYIFWIESNWPRFNMENSNEYFSIFCTS